MKAMLVLLTALPQVSSSDQTVSVSAEAFDQPCAMMNSFDGFPGMLKDYLTIRDSMYLAELYRNSLIRPRPLEQELESAVMKLVPVEHTASTVTIVIEPGNWGLRPDSMVTVVEDEPVQLVFTQNPQGSPYPSPVIRASVRLEWGDRILEFEQKWPVMRRTNAFRSEPVLDGARSPGEYRDPVSTHFADQAGLPSGIPRTFFQAATDGESLFIYMEMARTVEQADDHAGFIFAGPEGSFLWVNIHHDGRVESGTLDRSGRQSDWPVAPSSELRTTGHGWSLELAVEADLLLLEDSHAKVHVFRRAGEDFGTWAYPADFDEETMGLVWLQRH